MRSVRRRRLREEASGGVPAGGAGETVRSYGTTATPGHRLAGGAAHGRRSGRGDGGHGLLLDTRGEYPGGPGHVNPQRIQGIPGRKSDVRDAEWIADLLRHGLVLASYVPDRAQGQLRELTRYRTSLTEDRAREVPRLAKVLEGGHIKLGRVLTNLAGRWVGRCCEPWRWASTIRPPCSPTASGR